MISLVPDWAPNIHPLLVHFPISLLVAAVVVDLVAIIVPRPPRLSAASAGLYVAGAVGALAAYVSGLQASQAVFIPGMAHEVVEQHRRLALITAWYFGIAALVRLVLLRRDFPRLRIQRLLLLAIGLVGIAILYETADRGAQLVYRHGVGVIAAPAAP
jgi:uncharacterized membrane protein